jgi:hypothetical protein
MGQCHEMNNFLKVLKLHSFFEKADNSIIHLFILNSNTVTRFKSSLAYGTIYKIIGGFLNATTSKYRFDQSLQKNCSSRDTIPLFTGTVKGNQ